MKVGAKQAESGMWLWTPGGSRGSPAVRGMRLRACLNRGAETSHRPRKSWQLHHGPLTGAPGC